MGKVKKIVTPEKQFGRRITDVSAEQWESAFAYIRKHRFGPHKWRDALSLVPGVGLSTLKRRYRDDNSAETRKGPECRLGDDIENAIAEFLLAQADVGNAFPAELLPAKVQDIAKKLFGRVDLEGMVGGKDWEERFKKRHPELSVRLGQLTEATRLACLTREAVSRFYDIAEHALKGVKPENVWFMDESGIAARGAQQKVRLMYEFLRPNYF